MLNRPMPAVDTLSTALAQLKFRSIIANAFSAGGTWAVALPAHEGLKLHVLLRGTCWVQHGKTRLLFRAGDCLLTNGSAPIVIASHLPARKVIPIETLLRESGNGPLTVQGGEDVFSLAAFFAFDGPLHRVIFSRLPAAIHISESSEEASVLRWMVDRLRLEFINGYAGRTLILEHLAPILFVHVLRAYLATGHRDSNWLTALSDPALTHAIHAMHVNYQRPWTLSKLARLAGLSRSSFAAKFKQHAGISPMAYLAQTRAQVACELLRQGELNVGGVAAAVGYQSESAFSAVFQKIVGLRPGVYARAAAP